jgi:hypothetical protein
VLYIYNKKEEEARHPKPESTLKHMKYQSVFNSKSLPSNMWILLLFFDNMTRRVEGDIKVSFN